MIGVEIEWVKVEAPEELDKDGAKAEIDAYRSPIKGGLAAGGILEGNGNRILGLLSARSWTRTAPRLRSTRTERTKLPP